MKNFTSKIALILCFFVPGTAFTQSFKGNTKKFPEELLSTDVLVVFATTKEEYNTYKDKAVKAFSDLGLNYRSYLYLDENLNRREQQFAHFNETLETMPEYLLCFELMPVGQHSLILVSAIEVLDKGLGHFGTVHQINGKSFDQAMKRLYKKLDRSWSGSNSSTGVGGRSRSGGKAQLVRPKPLPYENVNDVINGYPPDLMDAKVALFKYDPIPVHDYAPKLVQSMHEKRNGFAKTSNGQLEETSTSLPFAWGIESRLDYEKLREKGYKYALDNLLMIGYNNGRNMAAGNSMKYSGSMFFIDLTNMDVYVTDVEVEAPYAYKYILEELIESIEGEF